MAHKLDEVRIGETYKINGFSYKVIGRCHDDPNKFLLLAVVATYAPRRPSVISPHFWSRSQKKKPVQEASATPPKTIKRLKLKLTEREILDRAAESIEDAIGHRATCHGHGGISTCVAAGYLRAASV